ncbi:(2Fe-2S)-binding protein [Acidicapsa dinghuensis]|uniref:(2Fe-2S)-binding protein n=1 Tax=Acidicapsa dinghuensis TaxID=2218256 RepID=A0ABW1EDA2_9BACT|nr:(2Fe-2S)-binding protein [Acidicapsa dinghuensis]
MNDFLLKINGADVPVRAPGEETLLSVLRNRLHLTGTKYGCGEGQCGACTVLIDGVATRSCQARLATSTGVSITTIEGLEHGGLLGPVQQAFLDEGAFQCGYCTSGMILSATALLHDHPRPTDAQIVGYMDGNVCRCGTYPRITAAIHRASQLAVAGEKGGSGHAHE